MIISMKKGSARSFLIFFENLENSHRGRVINSNGVPAGLVKIALEEKMSICL
jgi:hypothetical protein